MLTFKYIVGVDAIHSHHERAVLLRVTVEQEAVVGGGRFPGLEHRHVALGSCEEEDGDRESMGRSDVGTVPGKGQGEVRECRMSSLLNMF